MGTTIGINTMLLLAAAFEILGGGQARLEPYRQRIVWGLRLIQWSLFVFFISLILAGVVRAKWQMNPAGASFGQMMTSLRPLFVVISVAGTIMLLGFEWIIYHLLFVRQSASASSHQIKL
jgi:nitric oxide reductase subunit B